MHGRGRSGFGRSLGHLVAVWTVWVRAVLGWTMESRGMVDHGAAHIIGPWNTRCRDRCAVWSWRLAYRPRHHWQLPRPVLFRRGRSGDGHARDADHHGGAVRRHNRTGAWHGVYRRPSDPQARSGRLWHARAGIDQGPPPRHGIPDAPAHPDHRHSDPAGARAPRPRRRLPDPRAIWFGGGAANGDQRSSLPSRPAILCPVAETLVIWLQ